MPSKLTKTTTDHDEIRRWAEDRGAQPSEVERTERDGETGMIRLDFPGYSGAGSLKPISWDEWFQKFDQSGLALVYQDRTARGEKSNFNKLIARETAEARAQGDNEASRRSLRGRGRGGARASARRNGSARATSRRSSGSRSSRRSASGSRGRGAQRDSGGGRTGRSSASRSGGSSREAPRHVAARLTGRARMGSGTSSRGTSRGASGRGKSKSGSTKGRRSSGTSRASGRSRTSRRSR